MNTTSKPAVAEPINRRIQFHKIAATGVKRLAAFSGLMLLAFGGLHADAAEDATYKLFGKEVGGYASKYDLQAIVKKELGPRASVAEWNQIKAQYGGSEADLKAFCDKVGLAANGSAWVTFGGKPFWQEQRRYFIQRADHNPPQDFLAHDQLQSNFLLLGSWFESRPVLVKITGYNATDAEKFSKADARLKEASGKDISGVYTLISVDGKKVPATIPHEGVNLEIRSGAFTIKSDGGCSSKMTFVPPSGTEASVNTEATSTREGPKLTMQWKGAGMTTGLINDDKFTMGNEGMTFVYQKASETTLPK